MSKILIVEDEVAIAELEKDYLELSGFDVVMQHTGDAGLKAALNEDFNLIILDLMLPNVDGFEICKKVREKKNTPIIMVSAKKEDIDKIRGLGVGADDYMTKPFDAGELLARIRALTRRQGEVVGEALTTADLTLDLSGYYQSAAIQGTYDVAPSWSVNAGVKWTFDKSRASLSVRCNDIFESSLPFAKVRYKGQYLDMDSGTYTRSVTVHFSYRFGTYKEKRHKTVDTSRFGH